jgi:hypothetical protein
MIDELKTNTFLVVGEFELTSRPGSQGYDSYCAQPFFSSELTSRDGQTVKVQTVVSFDPEEAVCTQGSPNII